MTIGAVEGPTKPSAAPEVVDFAHSAAPIASLTIKITPTPTQQPTPTPTPTDPTPQPSTTP